MSEKDQDTEKQKEFQDLAKLEKIMSQVGSGWKTSIFRVRPSWCKGHLEVIDISHDEPIDLDYLINTWGGQVLRVRITDEKATYRGGCDLQLMSYPPKVFGQRIYRNQFDADTPANEPKSHQAMIQPQPAQNVNQSTDTLKSLIGMVTGMQKGETQRFGEMVKQLPTEPAAVGQGLGNVVDLIEQVTQLKQLFGGAEENINAAAAGGDESSQIFQMVGEVAKAFLNKEPSPPQSAAPRIFQQGEPRSLPNPPPPDTPKRSLPEILASMDPNKAAEIAFQAMGQMDENKRSEAIKHFMGRLEQVNDLKLEHEAEDGEGGPSDESQYPDSEDT